MNSRETAFGAEEQQEKALNDFDFDRRQHALLALLEQVQKGEIILPETRPVVNLHMHSFYSFNGYGYSPSALAWHARKQGFLAAGMVDFDVLDGVDEFLASARKLGLRACGGLETRVFVPEFSGETLNSPGEPGIAYFVGMGFPSAASADAAMLHTLKNTAQNRTRMIVNKVNPFLDPVMLDYERDVLPLTPSGNATERHVCMAYDNKARSLFTTPDALAAFWSEKLQTDRDTVVQALDTPPVLQGLIRAKTMKSGGVGYTRPEGPDFPQLTDVANFIKNAGAIPLYAWLDGTTEGEADPERLWDIFSRAGAAGINIIPERNWNIADPEIRKKKVNNLHSILEFARENDIPVIAGTEMNAYGQRAVDDFDAPELAPYRSLFLEGACILYAHTILQQAAKAGYLSAWASRNFTSRKDKNEFYIYLGRQWNPAADPSSLVFSAESTPEMIRNLVK